MENYMAKDRIHVGQNIRKYRMIGKKSQIQIAAELEERLHKPVSQQLISDIERRVSIDDDELLNQIADVLSVDPQILSNLDLNDALGMISNTFRKTKKENHFKNFRFFRKPVDRQANHLLDKLVELIQKEKDKLISENLYLKKEIEKYKKKR